MNEEPLVIIVDDEEATRSLFNRLLTKEGIRVLQAGTCLEAITLVKENKVKVIFLDEGLQGVDGFQALQEIKKVDGQDAKVILIAGKGSPASDSTAVSRGATEYITKPFDTNQIKRLVSKHAMLIPKFLESKAYDVVSDEACQEGFFEQTQVHILVVDDEPPLRKLLSRVLRQEGFEVDEAADGAEAIAALKLKRYDIIFTDLRMPLVDGHGVLKQAKVYDPYIQVVILTAYGTLGSAQEALRDGAYDYLLKPLPDIRDVVRVTRRALEGRILAKRNAALTRSLGRKVFELNALYEVSNAISYTLDYKQLVSIIMTSLHKIVPYDLASSLLLAPDGATLNAYTAEDVSERCVQESKKLMLSAFHALSQDELSETKISSVVERFSRKAPTLNQGSGVRMQTYFSVPLMVNFSVIGLIHVSAFRANAFSEDDIKLLYTVASQMSGAVDRLRQLIVKEKAKMELLVENMSEGVVMLDEEEVPVVVNPQARAMLGVDSKTIDPDALHKRFRTLALASVLEECRSKMLPVVKEIVVPQEESLILRCEASCVKDENGILIGVAVILRDVTREREVDRMKTEFVSIVSHELRTPLSITKEGIALVLDGLAGELSKKQIQILGTAQSNIDRLARIIGELLDISKLEAGRVELRKEPTDLKVCIAQICEIFQPAAKKKGLELRQKMPSGPIEVYLDDDRFRQVLINLLGNAIKFTRDGFVEVSAVLKEKEVECIVADSGRGISREDIPRVFNKFQQFGRKAGGGEKGTGLGLSIAKEIIGMHDGKIWVESDLGRGTRMHFTLPRHTFESFSEECLRVGIARARKQNSAVSVVAMSIHCNGMVASGATEEDTRAWVKLVQKIGVVIKKNLRQGETIAVKDTGRFTVVLPDCDKRAVAQAKARFGKLLEDYLRAERRDLAGKVILKMTSATYPDDGRDIHDLLQQAA